MNRQEVTRRLVEVAARRLFRKGDYGPKLIALLRRYFKQFVQRLEPDELRTAKQRLALLRLRPTLRDRGGALRWMLDQIGRRWLLESIIGRLARPDPEGAFQRWEAARSPTQRRKLLETATRLELVRAVQDQETLIEHLLAEIKKENAMPTIFTFDARGLPQGFDAAAQAQWNQDVDALIANTFQLQAQNNEAIYAGIKGILLLGSQFVVYDQVPGGRQLRAGFLDALRNAYNEVVVDRDFWVTRAQQDSNQQAYIRVAAQIPVITGRAAAVAGLIAAAAAGAAAGAVAAAAPPAGPTVYFQELASVAKFVIGHSADVPLNDNNFDRQIGLGLDEYIRSAGAFAALDLPPLGGDAQIVADNVRAVGTLTACYYLEKIRLLDVVDRVTELFFNGMIPIGNDNAGRALHDYYWSREDRLNPPERMSVYSRVIGVPGGDVSKEVQANKDYEPMLNRFIASVAEYDRQRSVSGMFQNNNARPLTFLGEHVRKAANDLGRNVTLYGYGGAQFAAKMISDAVQLGMRILSLPQILRAYGVTSPYQVIERVTGGDWNQQVNIVKFKTMAEAVNDVHEIIAANAALWSSTNGLPLFTEVVAGQAVPGQLPAGDQQRLFTHAQYWLAVNGVQDQQVEKLSQPVESKAGSSLPQLGGGSGAGADTINKLQQLVSGGGSVSIDQLKSLLPIGNA